MYEINEVVTLKKPHPCGGRTWKIVRTGADIKLQCETCGRYLNVTRDELKKRAKSTAAKKSEASNATQTDQG